MLSEIDEIAVFIFRPERDVLLQLNLHYQSQVIHQQNYGEGMFSGRIHHHSVATFSLSKSLPGREVVSLEELLPVILDS